MSTLRTIRTLLVTTSIVAAAAFAAPAGAQFGSQALAQSFKPYVMERDLPLLTETLALEEWQRPIVDALLVDYLASFNAGIEGVKTKMQEASVAASQNAADASALLRPLADWSRERQVLYTRFAELVRAQLSPQQLELWPAWERAIRRERLLPLGELSGEQVNLVGVMADVAPPPEVRTAATPAVTAYELRLDAALVQRQAREDESMPVMMKAMEKMDGEAAAGIQEKIMAARVQIRDAQEQSLREIAEAMGPEWGAKFRVLALQRAFPEVYGANPVQRLFDGALTVNDLTDEQRASITSLRDEFLREWNGLSDQYLIAVKVDEPQGPRRRLAGGAQPKSADVDNLRRQRQDRASHYREELLKLLKPEQIAMMPGGAALAAKTNPQPSTENPAHNIAGSRANPGAAPGAGGSSGAGSTPPTDTR